MLRWYVVQTKPGKETLAAYRLRLQNFEVFYPTFIKKTLGRGKALSLVLPLFPSYMFVKFDITVNPHWKSINGTRGVQGLVGCTEDFCSPVKKGCIEEIMERVGETGHITFETEKAQPIEFKPGIKLEILNEGLRGFIGTYCNHTKKLVTLNITLLNKEVRVVLPIEAVKAHKATLRGKRQPSPQ